MIRKAEEKDRDAFLLMAQDFYDSPAVLDPVPIARHMATFDEMMRSDVYLRGFIFEVDGEIAGYATLNITFGHQCGGRIVWIEDLYVKAEYRSKGIGKAFFDFVHRTEPAERYRLEVEPENERAIALYESIGYRYLGYNQYILENWR